MFTFLSLLNLCTKREREREREILNIVVLISLAPMSSNPQKMAKMVGILACLLIVAMDITAGILGIKAEAYQNKVCIHFTF